VQVTAGPLISVILSNHNHARYLGQAISCVLSQRYDALEVWIRDDASTDDSRKVIEEAARNDPRVHALYGSDRRGYNESARELIAKSSGDLFYFASSDDFVSSPDMFGECAGYLAEHPSAGAVCGRMLELHAANEDAPLWLTGHAAREGLIQGIEFVEGFFYGTILPVTSAAIVRRDAFARCGGIDSRLGPSSDLNTMAMIGASSGIVFLDRQYACYRIQPAHYSRSEKFDSYIEQMAALEVNVCRALQPQQAAPEWRRAFRERWIEYRLRARWQMEFLQGLSNQLATLDEWRLHYLPSAYGDLKDSIQSSIDSAVQTLNEQIHRGRVAFDRIAGPL
jgi:glycosyltransferase involved in cell wall biosynthesis